MNRNRIIWTDDFGAVDLPRDKSAVWLHHESEKIDAARTVDLCKFLDNPKLSVSGADLLVVCGLVSRLCTPSNRVKLGQFLTEPWFGPARVSVDRMLFRVDPWRAWWHFGCVGAPFAGCSTSFTLEGRYERWHKFGGENPCSVESFVAYGKGVVEYRGGFRFESYERAVLPVSPGIAAKYAEEKQKAFDTCGTIAKIVKHLSDFAQESVPERSVPKDIFRDRKLNVVATDLPIDKFLLSGIDERVELTNRCAEVFAC